MPGVTSSAWEPFSTGYSRDGLRSRARRRTTSWRTSGRASSLRCRFSLPKHRLSWRPLQSARSARSRPSDTETPRSWPGSSPPTSPGAGCLPTSTDLGAVPEIRLEPSRAADRGGDRGLRSARDLDLRGGAPPPDPGGPGECVPPPRLRCRAGRGLVKGCRLLRCCTRAARHDRGTLGAGGRQRADHRADPLTARTGRVVHRRGRASRRAEPSRSGEPRTESRSGRSRAERRCGPAPGNRSRRRASSRWAASPHARGGLGLPRRSDRTRAAGVASLVGLPLSGALPPRAVVLMGKFSISRTAVKRALFASDVSPVEILRRLR